MAQLWLTTVASNLLKSWLALDCRRALKHVSKSCNSLGDVARLIYTKRSVSYGWCEQVACNSSQHFCPTATSHYPLHHFYGCVNSQMQWRGDSAAPKLLKFNKRCGTYSNTVSVHPSMTYDKLYPTLLRIQNYLSGGYHPLHGCVILSLPVLNPCSSLSKSSICSLVMWKSNMLAFSFILLSLTDFGMQMKPFWMHHLSRTCAGDLWYTPEMLASTVLSNFRALTNGE